MHVFTTNTDWINTFMMSFMNEAIDAWVMQDAMSPIKNEIIIYYTEQDLPNNFNSINYVKLKSRYIN